MRRERWWWLAAFCAVSLLLHVGAYLRSRSFGSPYAFVSGPQEIEVALEPLPPEPKKAETPKRPEPTPKPATPAPERAARKPEPDAAPRLPRERAVIAKMTGKPNENRSLESRIREPRPPAPTPDPGGADPARDEKPMPLGQSVVRNDAPRLRTAPATPTLTPPTTEETTATPTPDEVPAAPVPDVTLPTLPRRDPTGGRSALSLENSLANADNEKPDPRPSRTNGAPKMTRIARADNPLAGGGSPAPSTLPGGTGGARGAEAPPDDLLFSGGGAGGLKLPRVAPRIGGGGGRSTPTVINPLASATIPEERPGAGPGVGGGQGAGRGGGVGFARGRGVGTDPNGRVALGTLRARPGSGIGAGAGSGVGTRAPGGGRGTGSELPGTGGSGFGYGRGSGVGVGAGIRPGVGGGGRGRGGSGSGNGGTSLASAGGGGSTRGIPFGDITGLLRGGDPNGGGGTGGGPGGRGRGAGAGGRVGGADAPVHIVYLLDISGSMEEGNKIGKAKDELIRVLRQLKPRDSFNIVTFFGRIGAFSTRMVPATPENIAQGVGFVDGLRTGQRTNISGAFERAFETADKVTAMYLLSDGEPSSGIEDFDELRTMVRERNRSKRARISTLALGLGDQFRGIPLLKGIAADNNGDFTYQDLSK